MIAVHLPNKNHTQVSFNKFMEHIREFQSVTALSGGLFLGVTNMRPFFVQS